VESDRIDAKDSAVLTLIQSRTEGGIGLLELLEKCRRGTLGKARIGSQHTLESRLQKLEARGLVGKAEGRHVGRGHKSGYFLTFQGKRFLEGQGLSSPSISFESPELEFSKLLPNASNDNREITVFSEPGLSVTVSSEDLSKLLSKLSTIASEMVAETEKAFETAHESSDALLKSGEWTDHERQILLVLRRRYTLQEKRGIKPGGRYRPEVAQMVRTLREENARLPKEKRKVTSKGTFTVANLPFEFVKKRLDDVPLGRREFQRYQELVRLERRYEEAWATMKEPSIALLVCNKHYIDELLVRAILVKRLGGKCEITDRFLKSLGPRDLLECENDFWEASNTAKYAKDLVLVECDEKGKRAHLPTIGPAPGQGVGLSYPLRASFLSLYRLADSKEAWGINIPLTFRLRKEYFEKMYAAISKEVQSRGLTALHHDARATYMDIVESRRKELEHQYGHLQEPNIREEALHFEVIFTIPGLRPKRLHAKDMSQLPPQFRAIEDRLSRGLRAYTPVCAPRTPLPVQFKMKLSKVGNSLRLSIPKPVVEELHLDEEDTLILSVFLGEIKVRKSEERKD
jgi:hypothetical protein